MKVHLVAHEAVAEAAVVGYPHDIKGQGIYVYITPNEGVTVSDELTKEVRNWVRKELKPNSITRYDSMVTRFT